MGGPEEISPKEEGTGASWRLGLAEWRVREFAFCAPVINCSSSTSMGFWFYVYLFGGECCLCHGDFEESCRRPLSGKMNTGDKSLFIIQEILRSP